MTRCEHVRKLNPPYRPAISNEIHDILTMSQGTSSGFPHAYPPYGRYAAEYWMMNDAGNRPEHDKPANQWPHLRNNHPEYHEPLIKKENTCTRHPPSEITKTIK